MLCFYEIGRGPVSWLSAKSSQCRSTSKPIVEGMLPLNLFELRAMQFYDNSSYKRPTCMSHPETTRHVFIRKACTHHIHYQ